MIEAHAELFPGLESPDARGRDLLQRRQSCMTAALSQEAPREVYLSCRVLNRGYLVCLRVSCCRVGPWFNIALETHLKSRYRSVGSRRGCLSLPVRSPIDACEGGGISYKGYHCVGKRSCTFQSASCCRNHFVTGSFQGIATGWPVSLRCDRGFGKVRRVVRCV